MRVAQSDRPCSFQSEPRSSAILPNLEFLPVSSRMVLSATPIKDGQAPVPATLPPPENKANLPSSACWPPVSFPGTPGPLPGWIEHTGWRARGPGHGYRHFARPHERNPISKRRPESGDQVMAHPGPRDMQQAKDRQRKALEVRRGENGQANPDNSLEKPEVETLPPLDGGKSRDKEAEPRAGAARPGPEKWLMGKYSAGVGEPALPTGRRAPRNLCPSPGQLFPT